MATKYIVKGHTDEWFLRKGEGSHPDPARAHPYSEEEIRRNWGFWFGYWCSRHPSFKPSLRQVRDL